MPALTEYTGTALGWVIVVAVGGAIYLYYKNDPKRRPIRARAHRAASALETEPQRTRAEKRNANTPTAGSNNTKQRQSKPKAEPVRTSQPRPDVRDYPEEKEDMSWATELANRKKGATFTAAPVRTEPRQKTVRQATANKVAANLSGQSSTTGGTEADDDISSVDSPNIASIDSSVRTSGDIRDMLEPVADGPSVIRLTEPENYPPSHTKQAPKPAQQAESKKQRQNRRKAEERKQQQEDIEKARKVQLESQRRTAREARGEPAKNGLASAVASNAWSGPKQAANAVTPGGSALLDTFDSDARPSKTNGTNGGWQHHNLPDEDEQMRLLMEEDESAWKTVSKKPKNKRKNTFETEDGGAVKPLELLPKHEPTEHVTTSANGVNGKNGLHVNADDAGWTVA